MLLAVHIGDGVLKLSWLIGGFVGMALLYWLGSRRLRDEEIPRIALLTAVFFVASTIHVPLGPTSVHLLLNALVGVLLGWRAALAIPVGLLLQALLLQHGGYFALGVNACVVTLPALAAWLAFRALERLPCIRAAWFRSLLVAVAGLVGVLSFIYGVTLLGTNLLAPVTELELDGANFATFHPLVLAGAVVLTLLFVWLERRMENAPEFPLGLLIGELTVLATAAAGCAVLLLGGDQTYFSGPPLILLVMHLPLAVIEGIILGITVGFLRRVKPEMLTPFSRSPAASAWQEDVGVGTCSRSPVASG